MSGDGYEPLIDREREPKSRVHEELTQSSKERFLVILAELVGDDELKYACHELQKKVGFSELHESGSSLEITGTKPQFVSIIFESKTEHALTCMELVINKAYTKLSQSNSRYNFYGYDYDDIYSAVGDIREVLITEGLLWEIDHQKGQYIQFQRLESQALEKIDEEIQSLGKQEPWNEALRGYNDAFGRYLNGDFDNTLVTKLYNSIEEVLQTICVDLEGWTENRDKSHGDYLEMLNDNGVYEANGITAPELNQLLNALEKMVSKVGHDRKQRHAYHDRAYCTLLIHQVGAYLYFLISRYDHYAN